MFEEYALRNRRETTYSLICPLSFVLKSVAESHNVYRWKDKHAHNDKGSRLLDLTIFIINDVPLHVIVHIPILIHPHTVKRGDRSSTVVKVLCYNSEGHWFDPNRCQWIFH